MPLWSLPSFYKDYSCKETVTPKGFIGINVVISMFIMMIIITVVLVLSFQLRSVEGRIQTGFRESLSLASG